MDKKEVLKVQISSLEDQLMEIENKMKEIKPKTDFSIKGIIIFKYIKCGKKKCICNNGVDLHGPYPHLQWYNPKTKRTKVKYLNRKIYPEIISKYLNNKEYEKLNKEKKQLLSKLNKLKEEINLN